MIVKILTMIKEFNYSVVKIVLSSEQFFEDFSCSLAYAIVDDYLDL